jgi:class 3 adenylate cyclase/outer membrane protein OmpA-like peptidoglycan-associated protein
MSADRRGRAERRLMAILAADVVGYSRLMGEDEEGTLAALQAVRREVTDPKIEEHRGRIVKTLGDGLLVEFASVVDAVRCAVEVQREMAGRNLNRGAELPIAFRIGINLGDIIIAHDDIFGDGVNVAARLEGLAEPGGICVSRVVRDQVRDKLGFGFEDMGPRQVKNIARPVHVFRVSLDAGLGKAGKSRNGTASRTVGVIGNGAMPAGGPAGSGPAAARYGRRANPPKSVVVAGLVAGGAVAVAAGLWSWAGAVNGVPAKRPSPVIGAPVLFERDEVVLIQSAGETLAEQAKFLRENPDVKVVIAASCARHEGAREGAWVLAELRANRVRDALRAQGVAGDRMTTANACKAGGTARLPDDVSKARDGQVFVLWK